MNNPRSSSDASSYTLSSVPRIRILLAPYMSPFDVPLAKVATWEQFVVMLQRLFGDSFCSSERPPHVLYQNGIKITQETWSNLIEQDLEITVHTAPEILRPTSRHQKEDSESTLVSGDNIIRQSFRPVKDQPTRDGITEEQVSKILGDGKKTKKGLWKKVIAAVSRNKSSTKASDASIERTESLIRSSSRKTKKKQARGSSQKALERELNQQAESVKPASTTVSTQKSLKYREKRTSASVAPLHTTIQLSTGYIVDIPPEISDVPEPLEETHDEFIASRRPSRSPPPIPGDQTIAIDSSIDSPTIPARTVTPIGIHAQYKCLDERAVRAAVEEVVLLRDKDQEHDEITLVDSVHDIPTLHKRSTSSKSVYRSLTSDGTRARRGTGSSTATTVPSRPNTSHSNRSRSNSSSAGLYRPTTPYDNKPLPKIPYKLSPFPARDISITNPAAITAMVKNGTLPPIATFEDLVKNTPSFSDAGADNWGHLSSTPAKNKKDKRKVSSSLNDATVTKKDWHKSLYIPQASDTGIAY